MSLKTDEAALGALIELQRRVNDPEKSLESLEEIEANSSKVRGDFNYRAQAHFEEYIHLGEAVKFFFETRDDVPMKEALAAIEAQD